MSHTLVWLTDECMQEDCIHHNECSFANGVDQRAIRFWPKLEFAQDNTGAGVLCHSKAASDAEAEAAEQKEG